MRISLFDLPLLIIVASALFLLTLLDTNLATLTASAAISNGNTCTAHSECSSNYCYPGPEDKKYCIAKTANCARPSTDGVQFDTSYSYNGKTYACVLGDGLVEQVTKISNGNTCTAHSECSSNYCYPGPEDKKYCISKTANCARPGTEGVQFGEVYTYNNYMYQCLMSGGLFQSEETPPLEEEESPMLACGISEARMEQIHALFDSVTNSGSWPHLSSTILQSENYPHWIYNVQEMTANVLLAAENCKDIYLLDELAKLYTIPFSYLSLDPNGNSVWANDSGYEEPLNSTQFIYAVAKLTNVIVSIDRSEWTPAMRNFVDGVPRGHLIAHLDRWMNEKTMWIWPQCGHQQSDYLREYTFQEYASKKYARTLGYAPGAPHYCNALNDIELWVGAAAMELVDADDKSHYSIGLGENIRNLLIEHVQTATDLFESRVTVEEIDNPRCGSNCRTALLDVGGWRGHSEYPAELWPDGGETWDFSHARRLVQYLDTMYSRPDISQSNFSEGEIMTLFANAIAYRTFNGAWDDPAFTNYMDGSNMNYRTYDPYWLSESYFRGGYGFWAKYNSDIARINDTLVDIVDNQTRTTYMTPEGIPSNGNLDILGFYASLTHPAGEGNSTLIPKKSLLANVYSATLGPLYSIFELFRNFLWR